MSRHSIHSILTSLLIGGVLISCGPVPSAEQKGAEAKAAEETAAMRAALEQLIAMQEQSLVQGIAQQSSAAPVDAAGQPPAPQAPRDPAPPDTYFLTERISVTTPTGVRGFEAGTRVLKVIDGLYTIEGEPVDVDPLKLTNDLEVIREIIRLQRERLEAAREARVRAQAPTPAPAAPVLAPDPFAVHTIGNTPPAPAPPARQELPPGSAANLTSSTLEDGPPSPLGRAVPLDEQELEVPEPELQTAVREYQSPTTGQRYQIRVTGAKVSE